MRILCYRSTSDWPTRERVWRLIYNRGFISDRVDTMWFYIPEHLLSFALLIDSTLKPMPRYDYIV
jgi:hypothetical protein